MVIAFMIEPGSYVAFTAGLRNTGSDPLQYVFGSKDGRLAIATIAPVCGASTSTVPPSAPVATSACANPCSAQCCTVASSVSVTSVPGTAADCRWIEVANGRPAASTAVYSVPGRPPNLPSYCCSTP